MKRTSALGDLQYSQPPQYTLQPAASCSHAARQRTALLPLCARPCWTLPPLPEHATSTTATIHACHQHLACSAQVCAPHAHLVLLSLSHEPVGPIRSALVCTSIPIPLLSPRAPPHPRPSPPQPWVQRSTPSICHAAAPCSGLSCIPHPSFRPVISCYSVPCNPLIPLFFWSFLGILPNPLPNCTQRQRVTSSCHIPVLQLVCRPVCCHAAPTQDAASAWWLSHASNHLPQQPASCAEAVHLRSTTRTHRLQR
jgi:hypothetical protein